MLLPFNTFSAVNYYITHQHAQPGHVVNLGYTNSSFQLMQF